MLQAGFILLTIALALALYIGASRIALKAIPDISVQKRFIVRTGLILCAWLVYICCISLTGVFTVATLPPRIPLLLVLPAFLFMGFFFLNSRFTAVIAATPLPWLVYLQSFRIIVELLIWGLFLKGLLPQAATFEGRNFDILIGITAPLVGYFTFTRRVVNKTVFLLWNFSGLITLAIVVFILLSHAYFPAYQTMPANVLTGGLGVFPFTYLAGFFMPLAVFLHVFAIIKATREPMR